MYFTVKIKRVLKSMYPTKKHIVLIKLTNYKRLHLLVNLANR